VMVMLCEQFHPGKNVGIGRDYTIYSLIDGLVKFEKFGPDRKKVRVMICPIFLQRNGI
jgi:ribosomal protein L27